MINYILQTISTIINGVIAWFTSAINGISTLFYTTANGFTFIGVIVLIIFGVNIVVIAFSFISYMIRSRTGGGSDE